MEQDLVPSASHFIGPAYKVSKNNDDAITFPDKSILELNMHITNSKIAASLNEIESMKDKNAKLKADFAASKAD